MKELPENTPLEDILQCGFTSWRSLCFESPNLQEGCPKDFGEITEIFVNGFLNGWLSCSETNKLRAASKQYEPFEPSKN